MSGSDNMKASLAVCDAFLGFNEELVKGCDDESEEDVRRHAREIQKLAELFRKEVPSRLDASKGYPSHALHDD